MKSIPKEDFAVLVKLTDKERKSISNVIDIMSDNLIEAFEKEGAKMSGSTKIEFLKNAEGMKVLKKHLRNTLK